MMLSNQLRCGARILLVLSASACDRVGFTLVHADSGITDAGAVSGDGNASGDAGASGGGEPDADASGVAGSVASLSCLSGTLPDASQFDAEVGVANQSSKDQQLLDDDAGVDDGVEDADRDGIPDDNDDDDDDDGFSDFEEVVGLTDPLNPRSPGIPNHYPGSILSDPCVQVALADYNAYRAERGLSPFVINLEHGPMNISGYYRGHELSGETEVSSSGVQGPFAFGVEFGYVALDGDDRYQTRGVGYKGHDIQFFWLNDLGIVRRRGDSFTAFGNQTSQVVIATTVRRDKSGNLIDNYELWVAVEPSGNYPEGVCTFVDWTVNHWSVHTRLQGTEITFMCSDDTDGYIPGMQWQSGEQTCTCTDSLDEACSNTADDDVASTDAGATSRVDAGDLVDASSSRPSAASDASMPRDE